MRYIWRTPIGTWDIRPGQRDDYWEIWWNDEECHGSHPGPSAAASHLHSQMTRNSGRDMQESFGVSDDIGDWVRID